VNLNSVTALGLAVTLNGTSDIDGDGLFSENGGCQSGKREGQEAHAGGLFELVDSEENWDQYVEHNALRLEISPSSKLTFNRFYVAVVMATLSFPAVYLGPGAS
jgi:hypothetical protein